MNDAICKQYNLKSEEEDMVACAEGMETDDVAYWTPVGVPGQRGVVCVGRVCNEVSIYLCISCDQHLCTCIYTCDWLD